jgi:tetratricopeptide (TPR) repeat protein
MGAVSYPNQEVKDFIAKNMIPVQLLYDKKPESENFNVKWTPTVIVLDPEGHEHNRTVGFLPPDQFIPSLMLGIGKIHFDRDLFEEAISLFDKILERYPASDAAPEAFYLRGVSRFKMSHDAEKLKETYEEIKERYPQSQWARRAEPYDLL